MNELVQLIVQKTGISEEQAQTVLQVIMTQLESKLPPQLSEAVKGMLSGQQSSTLVGEAETLIAGFFQKTA